MRNVMGWLLATAFCTTAALADLTRQPYRDGVIFPAPQAAMDAALVDFYLQWKAVYLIEGCGVGRAYVGVNPDRKWDAGRAEAPLTVSEAHGYGMLALVMMAGADADAHRLFDAMLRYLHDHPAASGPGLMAWRQVAGCGNAGGDDTATDGDLDIAYALLLAEKTWGNGGAFDYGRDARAVMAASMARVVTANDHLLIGDWAAGATGYATATRTSDFMMSHFQAFAAASGDGRWQKLRTNNYAVLQAVVPPDTGLSPDFVVDLPENPRPAPPGFLEGDNDGYQSWNALRTPWRLALDDMLYDAPEPHRQLAAVNAFIRAATGDDPAQISDTYRLDGTTLPDNWQGSVAWVSMFAVAAMTEPQNADWLRALWGRMLVTRLEDEDYYGNTLKLLAMVTLSGHWAKP
jgi:endoglucanase